MDMNKYNEWPANHKGDKNPSPKIIALGKRITDVAGHMIGGVTAEDPEYWGLAEIITEEMAEVGLTMKRRAHYTFDQLCEMNKDKVAEKGKDGIEKQNREAAKERLEAKKKEAYERETNKFGKAYAEKSYTNESKEDDEEQL